MRVVVVTAVVVAIVCAAGWLVPPPEPPPTPEREHVGYLGSDACRQCHPDEYAAWKAGTHSKALQAVSPSTVAGDFVGVEPVTFNQLTSLAAAWQDVLAFTDGGEIRGTIVSENVDEVLVRQVQGHKKVARTNVATIDYGAERRRTHMQNHAADEELQGEYAMALMETPPGELHSEVERYQVAYALGAAEQTQQYVTQLPDGRLQVLPLVWDATGKRWYDHRRLLPKPEDVEPGDPKYWRGYENTANVACLECHVSQLETNYNALAETYQSTWTEPGVNCETCHGPAADHVAITTRARAAGSRPSDLGLTSPKALSTQSRTHICAQCHSLRRTCFPELKPGDDYYDHFIPRVWFRGGDRPDGTPDDQHYQHPSLLRKVSFRGRYWPDGTPRDRNYQYLSLLQSRCVHPSDSQTPGQPLTCTDCHNPHANRLAAGRVRTPKTDGLCTRCHGDVAADLTAHTRHRAESPGSRCLNCHMPRVAIPMERYTVDHRITVPTPQATVAMEVPNACIECHRSETPEWVARRFTERYGEDPGGHLARTGVMMALTQGDSRAVGAGLRILADPDESPPLRATMATALAPVPYVSVQRTLLETTRDAHPLVQVAAIEALSSAWLAEHTDILAGLLRADHLAVRLTAARKFTGSVELIDRLSPDERGVLASVLVGEAFAVAERRREEPRSALDLGRIHWVLGRRTEAVRQYRLILKDHADFIPARASLAGLYLTQQRFEEALAQFSALADVSPDDLGAQVGAAQCLIPTGRSKEAVGVLEGVLELVPGHIPAHLHLGLAYRNLGDENQARAQWEEVLRLDPGNVVASALLGRASGGSRQ